MAEGRRSRVASHSHGSGVSGDLLIFLLVLSLAAVILGWSPLVAAQAAGNKPGTYVVEIEPSASDQAVWRLARQSLTRLDQQAVAAGAGESAELKAVAERYVALSSSVESAQGPSRFLLTGASENLVRSFAEGNLPQSALFHATTEVKPLSSGVVPPSDASTVTVSRSLADTDLVMKQISELNQAVSSLDELDAAKVSGTLAGDALQDLNEESLESLVQDDSSPVALQAQLELDRRVAANLPDLSGYSNGQLPDDQLCPIPWATRERILCATLDNFTRLNAAYHEQFGTNLPILDGYRPLKEQESVHYRDPNWTAVPGTSNHGWGLAIDFNWDVFKTWDDPEVKWMIQNGPAYGWRLPAALGPTSNRPEPWHYEFGTRYPKDDPEFIGPAPAVTYQVKVS